MKRGGPKFQMIINCLLMMLLVISLMSVIIHPIHGKPERDPVGSVAPPPDISIVTDNDQYSLSTEPGTSDHVVIIIGSVFCTMPDSVPSNTECYVQIFIECMMAEIDLLPLMTFTNEITKQEFTHEVVLKEGSPAGRIYNVIIYGNWQYDSGYGYGDINSETVIIEITQYGSVEIESNYIFGAWEMEVGKTEEFSIEVYNRGNGDDTLFLQVIDQPAEISVELEMDSILLKRNGKMEICVEVKQSEGTGMTGILKFRCSSSYQGIQSSGDLDVNYRTEEPSSDLSFAAVIAIFWIGILLVFCLIIVLIFSKKQKRRSLP